MTRKSLAILIVCLLLGEKAAWAHRVDEYLQATILSLDKDQAHASMRLIPGVLAASAVIAAIDTNHDGVFSSGEKQQYAGRVLADLSIRVDGHPAKPQLDSWVVPEASDLRDGLGEISIQYHVDLAPGSVTDRSLMLSNHHLSANSVYLMNVEVPSDSELRILNQKRNERQSIYEVDYQQVSKTTLPLVGATSLATRFPTGLPTKLKEWFKGLQLSSLFRLGMRHIAEGSDHLLFLLVLLLPAPLLAAGARWKGPAGIGQSLVHVVGIVTAFTLGHSLTLSLAAMDLVHVPSRPVEVLIALSILISAVHALRPLFPGREAWIAAFFGLIHGLAFASTLSRLGLAHWNRVAGILAFNLGIETMQLIVVAAVLPSLLILSRTSFYSMLRIPSALLAALAAILWAYERVLDVQTPVDALIAVLSRRGPWVAGLLLLASLVALFFARNPGWGELAPERAGDSKPAA